VSDITVLLSQVQTGDTAARERLYTLLYAELRRLARAHLSRAGGLTLEPSSLVHEVWLRTGQGALGNSRRQFFAHASVVMRSVLVDQFRERAASKRGGGLDAVTLDTSALEALPAPAAPLGLMDALDALSRVDERCHRVVAMRYFAGLSEEEIGDELGVSVPTVKRDWRKARAFLREQLSA
jgi:RNA polymerase sigma factor (TIGR02999 family)